MGVVFPFDHEDFRAGFGGSAGFEFESREGVAVGEGRRFNVIAGCGVGGGWKGGGYGGFVSWEVRHYVCIVIFVLFVVCALAGGVGRARSGTGREVRIYGGRSRGSRGMAIDVWQFSQIIEEEECAGLLLDVD